MKYFLKSGILYQDDSDHPLAQIKRICGEAERQILSASGEPVYCTNVRTSHVIGATVREYILTDRDGRLITVATPKCAEHVERDEWYASGMPQIDHAVLTLDGKECCLTMKNSRLYVLVDEKGREAVRILHRGRGRRLARGGG